jgi:MFS family permease
MGPGRVITLAVAGHAAAILPLILLGTMAVNVRHDLGFDEAAFGAIPALCAGVAAVGSPLCGRLVERFGGTWGLQAGAVTAAASMFGIAVLAVSWLTLLPFVVVAGVCLAVAQPSSDTWLANLLTADRHGMAFGIKQAAAGPGVGLLAGLAVPLSVATVGWRGAFVVGGGLAVLVLVGVRRARVPVRAPRDTAIPEANVSFRPLLVLTCAGGLGAVSQSALLGFAVSSAVATGLSTSEAGLLFAAASGAAVVVRLVLGHMADRRPGGLLVTIAVLMIASAGGFAVLAGHHSAGTLIGTPIAAATAWGWPGLFFLVVARCSPSAPARASGIAASGVMAGAVLGPLSFGIVAQHSYPLAWVLAGVSSVVAAVGMLVGRHYVRRDLLGRRGPIVAAPVPAG